MSRPYVKGHRKVRARDMRPVSLGATAVCCCCPARLSVMFVSPRGGYRAHSRMPEHAADGKRCPGSRRRIVAEPVGRNA